MTYNKGNSLDTSGIVVKALIGSTYVEVTNSVTYTVPSGNTSSLQTTDTYVTCHLTIDSTDYTTTYSITVYNIFTMTYSNLIYASFADSSTQYVGYITVDGTVYSGSGSATISSGSTVNAVLKASGHFEMIVINGTKIYCGMPGKSPGYSYTISTSSITSTLNVVFQVYKHSSEDYSWYSLVITY